MEELSDFKLCPDLYDLMTDECFIFQPGKFAQTFTAVKFQQRLMNKLCKFIFYAIYGDTFVLIFQNVAVLRIGFSKIFEKLIFDKYEFDQLLHCHFIAIILECKIYILQF